MQNIKKVLTNIKISNMLLSSNRPLEVERMKGINKLGKIIPKILEVFHRAGAALLLGGGSKLG